MFIQNIEEARKGNSSLGNGNERILRRKFRHSFEIISFFAMRFRGKIARLLKHLSNFTGKVVV